jgi:NDP-sugar pyrophosphorylase family protein
MRRQCPSPRPASTRPTRGQAWEQARISGPVWIGPGSRLEPGAVVEGPAWIGSGCRIGPCVRLTRCVVENHTSLPEPVHLSDRYVVRNRAFAADGSTLVLGDALVAAPIEQDAASAT